jgi:hypothetical protein
VAPLHIGLTGDEEIKINTTAHEGDHQHKSCCNWQENRALADEFVGSVKYELEPMRSPY